MREDDEFEGEEYYDEFEGEEYYGEEEEGHYGEEADLEVHSVKEAICYSYILDPKSPNFLSRSSVIFDLSENMRDYARVSPNPTTNSYQLTSKSNSSASQKIAKSMGVSGYYYAFSGSIDMSCSSESTSSVRTIRTDAYAVSTKYKLQAGGLFRRHPWEFLNQNFKEGIMEMSNEMITNTNPATLSTSK